MKLILFIIIFFIIEFHSIIFSCSMFYYIDKRTNKIYFINNEDYWYDVKVYIKIIPRTSFLKNKYGRIWYGWDDFGQGGVNEKGLVIDGAVTPIDSIPKGYHTPKGNITDEILSYCSTTQEAIDYLEKKRIALNNAHVVLGDRTGDAAIIEWVNGKKEIIRIKNRRLIATNFHLSKNNFYQCWRYKAIKSGLKKLDSLATIKSLTLKDVGSVIAKAVQPPIEHNGKIGGTLYTTFYDLTDMKLVLVYKLDNSKIYKFDIIKELNKNKKRIIHLD